MTFKCKRFWIELRSPIRWVGISGRMIKGKDRAVGFLRHKRSGSFIFRWSLWVGPVALLWRKKGQAPLSQPIGPPRPWPR